jgi:hypothetical protein
MGDDFDKGVIDEATQSKSGRSRSFLGIAGMGTMWGDYVRGHGDHLHGDDTDRSCNWRASHLFGDLLVLFHEAELHIANTDSSCIHTDRGIHGFLLGSARDQSKLGDVPECIGYVDTICSDILVHVPYRDGSGGEKQEAVKRLEQHLHPVRAASPDGTRRSAPQVQMSERPRRVLSWGKIKDQGWRKRQGGKADRSSRGAKRRREWGVPADH